MGEFMIRKTLAEILLDFEVACRAKSIEELRNLLIQMQSMSSIGGEIEQKIKIIERILAEKLKSL